MIAQRSSENFEGRLHQGAVTLVIMNLFLAIGVMFSG